MELNYEQDVNIDPDSLDTEWLEQPRLMMKYAKAAANAKKRVDQAKEQVEVTKAELDRDIRTNPDGFGISKITETVVQNTITLQAGYQEVMADYIEAKYEFDFARYAVQAMQERKDALENLVKLHGMQYFAGPSVLRDLSKEWEAKQKQKESDNKVTMKRKKKK
jgi:hypothetical protein